MKKILIVTACYTIFVYFWAVFSDKYATNEVLSWLTEFMINTPSHNDYYGGNMPFAGVMGGPFKTSSQVLADYNRGVSGFDTRVRFWGKIVDQDGKPIEGARIVGTVTTFRMVKSSQGFREFEVVSAYSAADGSFKFDGANGFSLNIVYLGKDGYVLPSAYQIGVKTMDARYYYCYKAIGRSNKLFHPDPARPVLFHLHKLQHPEPVVIHGKWSGTCGPEFKVGATPEALTFSGRFGSGFERLGVPEDATLAIREIEGLVPTTWEVTVTAVEPDGGVIAADPADVFMFEAPESGYSHSLTFRFVREGADELNEDDGALLRFFVRSKGGKWHTAVQFALFAPDQHGIVTSNYRFWMNPSGSRNLEHDSANPLRCDIITRRNPVTGELEFQ